MDKEFVTYEQALALKELGFDEPCIGYYYNNKIHFNSPGVNVVGPSGEQPLPLKQQVFRWFREKHGLGHMINGIGFESFIMNIGGVQVIFDSMKFRTYEEAENACIDKLIQLVKNE